MPRNANAVRLWARRPDVNILTAGLASLAVAVPLVGALPDLAEHPHWWQFQAAIAIALGLFGLALLYRGILSPVPLIDVEEPWNVAYDRLRNATHQFLAEVAEASFSAIREKDPTPLQKWDDYAAYVPLPLAEVGPLHACEHDLTGHEDLRVRLFFELARACEGIRAGSEWRRLPVAIAKPVAVAKILRGFFGYADGAGVELYATKSEVLNGLAAATWLSTGTIRRLLYAECRTTEWRTVYALERSLDAAEWRGLAPLLLLPGARRALWLHSYSVRQEIERVVIGHSDSRVDGGDTLSQRHPSGRGGTPLEQQSIDNFRKNVQSIGLTRDRAKLGLLRAATTLSGHRPRYARLGEDRQEEMLREALGHELRRVKDEARMLTEFVNPYRVADDGERGAVLNDPQVRRLQTDLRALVEAITANEPCEERDRRRLVIDTRTGIAQIVNSEHGPVR